MINSKHPGNVFEKLIPSIPKGNALEIGPGSGRYSRVLAENDFKVEAVDIDKKALNKIEKYAKKKHLPITLYHQDIREFNFRLNHYNFICAIASLDFISKRDKEQVGRKIVKSLRENGQIFIIVFSKKDSMYPNKKMNFSSKEELKKIFKGIKTKIEERTFYEDHGVVGKHKHTVYIITGIKKEESAIR